MQSQRENPMQGQQAQGTARTAHPATAMAGATETSLSAEDAFDAMRQAAVTMFKQRTKDLTKLSQLQVQQRSLEGQVAEVEGVVADLQAHQAEVEALVEKEGQRGTERAADLHRLHDAMNLLSEEQRVLQNVSRTADRVAAVASTVFAGDGRTEGVVPRLLKLLTAAQARTGGRSSHDFRNLSTDLRRREAVLRERLGDIRRTGSVPASFVATLTEWVRSGWQHHAELAAVVADAATLLDLVQHGQKLLNGGAPGSRGRSGSSSPSPALLALSSAVQSTATAYPVTFDEEAFFEGELPTTEAFAAEDATAPQRKLLLGYLQELKTIHETVCETASLCDKHGVVCEMVEPGVTEALEEQWKAFTNDFAEWLLLSATHRKEAAEQAALVALEAQTQTEVQNAQVTLDNKQTELQANTARGELLEKDCAQHLAAWGKVCRSHELQATQLREARELARSLAQEKDAQTEALTRATTEAAEEHRANEAALAEEEAGLADVVRRSSELESAHTALQHVRNQLASLQCVLNEHVEALLSSADATEVDDVTDANHLAEATAAIHASLAEVPLDHRPDATGVTAALSADITDDQYKALVKLLSCTDVSQEERATRIADIFRATPRAVKQAIPFMQALSAEQHQCNADEEAHFARMQEMEKESALLMRELV